MRQKRKKANRWIGAACLCIGILGGGCAAYAWGSHAAESAVLPTVQAAASDTLTPQQATPPQKQQPAAAPTGPLDPPESELFHDKNIELRQSQARYDAYVASLKNAQGTLVGSFSTSLAGHSAEGRVKNIMLAANKINGTTLMPGDSFSFNNATGDSNDPKAGWQLATVIVGKQFEEGYGGGICQVSSTMYNSVLKAGLQIDERHTHSLPVGYVQPGHDATVSYPELDFRFTNSYPDAPVRLTVEIANGNVICKLFKLPAMPPEKG